MSIGRCLLIAVVTLLAIAGLASALFGMNVKKMISDPINQVMFSNKCVEDVGCFFTGPPFFHPIYRPISLPPTEGMKPKFWLYTPTQKHLRYRLEPNEESLEASTFDETLPTKFLIHGFMAECKEGDARHRMKDAFLEEGDYNIIIVDWTEHNGRPYIQAVSNTRMVGAQIAQLIRFLQKTRGISPQSVHLIGHSLGSHIAGYAGEKIPNLARISGMDPAGPYFSGTDDEVRLDTSDADFVDIIHTNMGKVAIDGLGMPAAIGHVDFYPNGGEHQPLCKPTILNVTFAGVNITAVGDGEGLTALMATSCDHNAANEYYIASIKYRNCTFVGTECKSYELFEEGGCSSNMKAVMGYPATKTTNVHPGDEFYLETTDQSPYCLLSEQLKSGASR